MAAKKITVDREEYLALCDLKDGVDAERERLTLKLKRAENYYSECLEVNHEQGHRLAKLTIEVAHLREANLVLEAKLADAKSPIVRSEIQQPAFARKP